MSSFFLAEVASESMLADLDALTDLAAGKSRGGPSVRVKGVTALQRDLKRAQADCAKDVRKAVREAAEPVRRDVAAVASKWGMYTASGYTISVRRGGELVAVQQRRRRTTGKRPDFGTLQMVEAMIPALVSFCINMLPFIAAYFLMRKQAKDGNVDLGH